MWSFNLHSVLSGDRSNAETVARRAVSRVLWKGGRAYLSILVQGEQDISSHSSNRRRSKAFKDARRLRTSSLCEYLSLSLHLRKAPPGVGWQGLQREESSRNIKEMLLLQESERAPTQSKPSPAPPPPLPSPPDYQPVWALAEDIR